MDADIFLPPSEEETSNLTLAEMVAMTWHVSRFKDKFIQQVLALSSERNANLHPLWDWSKNPPRSLSAMLEVPYCRDDDDDEDEDSYDEEGQNPIRRFWDSCLDDVDLDDKGDYSRDAPFTTTAEKYDLVDNDGKPKSRKDGNGSVKVNTLQLVRFVISSGVEFLKNTK